jgi:hypothetical protein
LHTCRKFFEKNGYRFNFYSNENKEKAHVHIKKGNRNAKFWLEPDIQEKYSYGFRVRERRDIRNHYCPTKNHQSGLKPLTGLAFITPALRPGLDPETRIQ